MMTRAIESNGYNPDGSLGVKSTYKYDNRGNVIEEIIYNSDGRLKEKRTYTYDYIDNVIEENIFIEASEYNSEATKSKYTYEYKKYDARGNWIEKIKFARRGEVKEAKAIIERKITYY